MFDKITNPNIMKLQLTTLLLLISIFTYSQTKFQKGYFIKTNGDKVECLIKNEDWKNNPTDFAYKLTEDSEIQSGDIAQIIEFSIGNSSKFIKQEVDVDISTNHVSNLSYLKEPEWEKRTVFLKVLLSGKASLYFYASPGINRYFYNLENGKVIQLIYKRYQTFDRNIKVNNSFRQQLYNSFLDCSSLEIKDFNAINYNQPSLSKIITAYNDCSGSNSDYFEINNASLSLNLKVKGGLNISSVNNVKNGLTSSRNANFGNMLGYRFALESEIILPFNNNKWGLFFEFAKNQKLNKTTKAGGDGNVTLTYDYIEGTLGMRHYLYINSSSKASIHVGYAWDLFPKIEMDYDAYNGFEADNVSGKLKNGL